MAFLNIVINLLNIYPCPYFSWFSNEVHVESAFGYRNGRKSHAFKGYAEWVDQYFEIKRSAEKKAFPFLNGIRIATSLNSFEKQFLAGLGGFAFYILFICFLKI